MSSAAARQPVSIASMFASGAVVAGVLASIVLYDLFVYFFGIPVPRETVFLMALAIVVGRVGVMVVEPRSDDEHFISWLAITLLGYQAINLLVAILTTGEVTRTLYFAAPIVAAYLAIECPRAFKVVLIFILCAMLASELIETVTAQYQFFSEDRRLSGVFWDDFMGENEVFRAKGLFAGPLTAAYVSLGIALVFRRSMTVLVLCLLCAAAANGRGAMLWITVLAIVALVRDFGSGRSIVRRFWSGIILLGAIYVLGAIVLDENAIERVTNMFSPSENSNSARMYYWEDGWQTFWSTDSLFGFLFGQPNLFRREFDNSAENDHLQILLDYGILGFLLFFGALMWTLSRLKASLADRLFVLGLLCLMMFVAPPLSTMTCSVLFWFFLFGEVTNARGVGQTPSRRSFVVPGVELQSSVTTDRVPSVMVVSPNTGSSI